MQVESATFSIALILVVFMLLYQFYEIEHVTICGNESTTSKCIIIRNIIYIIDIESLGEH